MRHHRTSDELGKRSRKPEKPARGLQLLQAALAAAPARRWNLRVDGTVVSGEFIGVELMRVREIGPNLARAPEAGPSSDRFQVVTVRGEDREQLADWARSQAGGGSPVPVRLPTWTGSSVEFEAPAGCMLHVDDDP